MSSATLIFSNRAHKLNAFTPILVIEPDISTEVILVFWNAFAPIVVTDLGIVIETRFVQFWNAFSPILVTLYMVPDIYILLGIFTDVILDDTGELTDTVELFIMV